MAARSLPADKAQRATAPAWIGWLCLVPAVVLLVLQMIVPTVRLLVLSFQASNLVKKPEWVGLQNWSRLGDVLPSFGFGLVLASTLLIGLIIVGPLIGVLATRGPQPLAHAVRVLLAVLLVIYAPTAMALGRLITAEDGPPSILLSTILIYLPITVGATGLLVLSAGGRARTMMILGVLALGAAVSWGLQSFTMPMVLTGGGPGRSTATPAFASFEYAYRQLVLGHAAMINLLVLIIAALLGVLVGLLLITTRVDADIIGRRASRAAFGSASNGALFGVSALVLTLLVAVLVLFGHGTWVAGLFDRGSEPQNIGPGVISRSMINDWLPAAIAAVIQLVVAVVGGVGLGFFRPLGSASRWLLLIFAPGLFIGAGPYLLGEYVALADADRLGSWWILIPRPWLIVPALFGFTWLASAIRRRYDQTRSWYGVPGPALGGLLLGLVVLVMVQAQALQRDLVMAPQDRLWSADVLLLQYSRQGLGRDLPLWLGLPLPILMAAAVASAIAALLLRRVRITTAGR
jgi:ABC-type sugar transport system permease subunit